MSQDNPKPQRVFDLIHRGVKRPTPIGTGTFIGLRLLDIPWQYHLLHGGAARILSYWNLSAIGHGVATTSRLGVPYLLTKIDLPWPHFVLLTMAAGSSLKQILWVTRFSQEEFPVTAAVPVSIYNTVFNTANTLLFIWGATSSWSSASPTITRLLGTRVPLSFVVGGLAYAAGMCIETLSEYQRVAFKRDARNQGKVCKVGLWRWARHVNYFGYALWRGGYAMAATGWFGGLLVGLWQGWDLGTRAVGVLDAYCSERYGEQWVQFKRDVPYRVVPGVW